MKNKHEYNFIFVHGAWLGAWAWAQLEAHMEERGFSTIAIDLPGHGKNKEVQGPITFFSYVEEVIRTLDKIEGPAILVGHSFAGVIISQVAEYRSERLAGLVYLCAFLLPNHHSFNSAAKKIEGSIAIENLEVSQDGKTVTIKEDCLHSAVAHDVPVHLFESAKVNLVPEPFHPLGVPLMITNENWGSTSRFYIECTEDRVIPLKAQQAMHKSLGVRQVFSLNSSHSPMFSYPLELCEHLIAIANSLSSHSD